MTSPLAHWLLCIFVRQVEEIILTFSKILFLNKSHHVTTFDWLIEESRDQSVGSLAAFARLDVCQVEEII